MSIDVRIVDCVYNQPADGVSVDIVREFDGAPVQRWRGRTAADGRLVALPETMQERGSYTIVFDVSDYFATLGHTTHVSMFSLRMHVADELQSHRASLLITPSSCVAFTEV
jgi:5-hydroxyisourate hydrolase-like protein (transthyretin family)